MRMFNLPNQAFGYTVDDKFVVYEEAPGVYPLSSDWVPAPPDILYDNWRFKDFIRLNDKIWLAWSAKSKAKAPKVWQPALLRVPDGITDVEFTFAGGVHRSRGYHANQWLARYWSPNPDVQVFGYFPTEVEAINFLVKFVQEYVK